ncbi:hypothetical protein HOV93_08930 [Planctomycetes bacterium FF15]|uniref:Uncharacterized protein n=1 Tax=Bremerella alba TaxID=980252 RepID=A0A7V8V2I6_9BACT|nr:hypothetical protein [Bremerella alba]
MLYLILELTEWNLPQEDSIMGCPLQASWEPVTQPPTSVTLMMTILPLMSTRHSAPLGKKSLKVPTEGLGIPVVRLNCPKNGRSPA